MKQLVIEVAKCTGCNQCALTCAFEKTTASGLHQSRIQFVQWENICLSFPLVCQKCEDLACVRACPSEALGHHPVTGAIILNKEVCNPCEARILQCTYQVMHLGKDHFPVICDLCDGDPTCVKVCCPGALRFSELPEHQREPFRQMVQVLVDRSAGKDVRPPAELIKLATLAG